MVVYSSNGKDVLLKDNFEGQVLSHHYWTSFFSF